MNVCLIAEGSYPVTAGGVSVWCHNLISRMKDTEFHVFTVTSREKSEVVYEKLSNVGIVKIVPLFQRGRPKQSKKFSAKNAEELSKIFKNVLEGKLFALENVVGFLEGYELQRVLLSRFFWDVIVEDYEKNCSTGVAFKDYFWEMINVFYLIFDVLCASLGVPEADVFHALNSGFAGLIGAVSKIRYKKPLVITEHGIYLNELDLYLKRTKKPIWARELYFKLFESIIKTSYSFADRITAVTRYHQRFQKRLSNTSRELKVIYNGIDLTKFKPLRKKHQNEVPLVLTIARVVPVKGLNVLVAVAREVLQKRKAKFVVVGPIEDKEYFNEIMNLIDGYELGEAINFIGMQDSLKWLQSADIYLNTSVSEGMSLASLEAAATGLPLVLMRAGGNQEILEGTGTPVPSDSKEAADQVISLIDDPDLRKKTGLQLHRKVEQDFDVNKMVKQYSELYRQAIAGEMTA